MSWQNQDNKNQRGEIDRVFVSPTEDWELDYFIQHYLHKNNELANDENKEMIRYAISVCPLPAPVKRETLTAYLDNMFKK